MSCKRRLKAIGASEEAAANMPGLAAQPHVLLNLLPVLCAESYNLAVGPCRSHVTRQRERRHGNLMAVARGLLSEMGLDARPGARA